MKLVAIMPVRNEDWVLGLSARALLQWVDELVILDHRSRDCSREIEMELIDENEDGRVCVIYEDNPVWEEMRHRQRLLEAARERGATHIVTIDADEALTANLVPHIRGLIESTPDVAVLQLPWLTMRDSITQCHASGLWAEQYASTAFKDSTELHWAARDGYDFHHRHPCGRPQVPHQPITHKQGGIMHFQYSNRRRLLAKQALYKITEVVRWPGKDSLVEINKRYNYSVYGSSQSTGTPVFDLRDIPASWWSGYEPLMQHLNLDAEPWQEIECKRMVLEHGRDRFAGLDLYGVV
jgi:hypothetical protein